MLINRELILAKTESTYGEDAAPTAADDSLLVENISWSNEGLRLNARPAVRSSLGQLQQIYGGTLRSLSFDVEIKGSGVDPATTATAPEFAALLGACGLSEKINDGASVVYTPVSDPAQHESITLYYYQDGIRYALLGCRGNCAITLETGAIGKMNFNFTGHLVDPVNEALPNAIILTHSPESVVAGAFTIGTFGAVVSATSLDLSNTLATPPDISAADGYGEVQITARDPNGSYDPEAELLNVNDPWAAFKTGERLAMNIGPVGATAGNRYTLAMPAVSYRDVTPGDRDGIRVYEIPFGAAEVATDDELTLTFT